MVKETELTKVIKKIPTAFSLGVCLKLMFKFPLKKINKLFPTHRFPDNQI